MMLAGVSVISIVLFIAVIVFAIMAVSFKDQLSAAISLAALSAALAIIFYRLNSPYAAVIELSIRSSYQFNQEKIRN